MCPIPQEAFERGISSSLGLEVNRNQPGNLEIQLNIEGAELSVLVLLKKRENTDNITEPQVGITLPSTVAHSMIRLAELCAGDVVLDPMCGSCSIPVEGAQSWPLCWFLSGDIDIKPTMNTRAKLEELGAVISMDNARWNARRLPLKGDSIDAIVTELPSGLSSGRGSRSINTWKLYESLLREFSRVINKSCGRAVLLTQDPKPLDKVIGKSWEWKLRNTWNVLPADAKFRVFILDNALSRRSEDRAEF